LRRDHLILEVLKDHSLRSDLERALHAGRAVVWEVALDDLVYLLLREDISLRESDRRRRFDGQGSAMRGDHLSVDHVSEIGDIHSSDGSQRERDCPSLSAGPSSRDPS
jgi:hypothetical protein